MPVTPSFPGIYIEELPSSARTITAAATSIAVFIGYTHPFKTKPENFGKAVLILNFTEYEREFGGLFHNDRLESHVPYAVQQFFLNGGSIAYVVGLQAQLHDGFLAPTTTEFSAATKDVGGIRFTAREPTDSGHEMKVTVTVLDPLAPTTADITVTYGARAETFRSVKIADMEATGGEPARFNKLSSLVSVAPTPPAVTVGPTFTATAAPQPLTGPVVSATAYTFFPGDFTAVFADDSSLDKVDLFNLMVLPGVAASGIWSQALAFCEKKRAFLIMDPPPNASADSTDGGMTPIVDVVTSGKVPTSANGAIYFPYLKSIDSLTGQSMRLPPSGFVAGIFARTDLNRGVWKAPAGLETTVNNTVGVVEEGRLTDLRAGVLNNAAVNALRTFPGVGTVVFGARTLVAPNPAFQQWKYVPVRRMALFIEQTLYRNLGWVVFEPNDEPLWVAVRTSIDAFMLSLFRQGAFQGSMPSQAFQVKCDSSTTTQTDIDNGIVNIQVAFRPLKPAEFVVIKLAQLAGQVQA